MKEDQFSRKVSQPQQQRISTAKHQTLKANISKDHSFWRGPIVETCFPKGQQFAWKSPGSGSNYLTVPVNTELLQLGREVVMG